MRSYLEDREARRHQLARLTMVAVPEYHLRPNLVNMIFSISPIFLMHHVRQREITRRIFQWNARRAPFPVQRRQRPGTHPTHCKEHERRPFSR